jgi:glycosyltransferase involved in cell wall biosynthesis
MIPRLSEKLNFLGAYRIAAMSDALKQNLLSGGVDEAKTIVNPNGVDPVKFGPQVDASGFRSGPPSGKLLVGFIGVFGQWHGVLTLMRTLKRVIKACAAASLR